jgi:hypothetical protein
MVSVEDKDSRITQLQDELLDEIILRQIIKEFSSKETPKWQHKLVVNKTK